MEAVGFFQPWFLTTCEPELRKSEKTSLRGTSSLTAGTHGFIDFVHSSEDIDQPEKSLSAAAIKLPTGRTKKMFISVFTNTTLGSIIESAGSSDSGWSPGQHADSSYWFGEVQV